MTDIDTFQGVPEEPTGTENPLTGSARGRTLARDGEFRVQRRSHTEEHEMSRFDESQSPYGVLPTDIKGVFVVSTFPGDFDPSSVGDGELVRYGFPPVLEEARKRVGSVRNRNVPDMDVQVGVTHNVRELGLVTDTDYLSTNMAGNVVGSNLHDAQGAWFIPTVSVPNEPQGEGGGWRMSTWVGLGDFSGQNDALRAGIEQRVDAAGNATHTPWYLWSTPFDFIRQTINFPEPPRPGNEMSVIVAYNTARTQGFVQIGVKNTADLLTLSLDPPRGATFIGATAGWIVSTFFPDPPSSQSLSLPRFTPVTFTSAEANSDAFHIEAGTGGDVYNIVTFNVPLTAVSSDHPGNVTISYIGP